MFSQQYNQTHQKYVFKMKIFSSLTKPKDLLIRKTSLQRQWLENLRKKNQWPLKDWKNRTERKVKEPYVAR